MALTKLHFQFKAIKFTNDFMYNYDHNMSSEETQATNVSQNNKRKFLNSTLLCKIIIINARASLWKISHNKVNYMSTKKEDYQFQVRCMSYLNLKKNKAFKEKGYKSFYSQFYSKTSKKTKKTIK